MINLWGPDFGIIAVSKKHNGQAVNIEISNKNINRYIKESDFWLKSLEKVVKNKTKFGRIGLIFDRKNSEAVNFYESIKNKQFIYKQKNQRSEKIPKIYPISTQLIKDFANEGLADSPEFRRILRKYAKITKNENIDSVLFLEGIFAEKETCKIIAKTFGKQIKSYFIDDFIEHDSNPAKKKFNINTSDNYDFTKKRAEKILKRKLKKEDINIINN